MQRCRQFFGWLLLLIRLSTPISAQPTYPLGLLADDAGYEKVPLKAVLTKDSFDKLPPRVSYEAYCPPVMNQAGLNTCVAFATTYYLRTMLDAIRRQQVGGAGNESAFSPSYTYEKIKTTPDANCRAGSRLPDALFALKTYGAPRYEVLPYPNCDDPGNTLDDLAAPHKIGDVVRLFGKGANPVQKVLFLKKALNEGYPVVIGMHTPRSFFATRLVWEPAPGDALGKDLEGHALCVVGYDDTRFGGAFRVVNSWGTAWADGGFCWIRYNDLARFTPYAFQAFPALAAPVTPLGRPAGQATDMAGNVALRLRDGRLMPIRQSVMAGVAGSQGALAADPPSLPIYRVVGTYATGTAFKLFVSNSRQAYIYAIGTDTTYKMTRLFPYADGISPLLGPNTTVVYPSETKSIALDATQGTDYLLVLFSKKPLDCVRLTNQLQRLPGNLADRVTVALKDDLVGRESIRYRTDAMEFELDEAASGSVVPVLVVLDHR